MTDAALVEVERRRRGPLARVENGVLALMLAATAVIVLLQVFARYVLDRPLTWSGEVATDLLVWVTFLGFAVAIRDRSNVAMSIFVDRLPDRAQPWLALAQLVLFGLFMLALLLGGLDLMSAQGDQVSPSGIPAWAVYLSIPVGAGLGLVHVIEQVIRQLAEVLDELRRGRRVWQRSS